MTSVLNFLEGMGTDHKGRSIDGIRNEDDTFWSHQHDFFQWLFPLNQKSMSVPNSPVIRHPEIDWIKESPKAIAAIRMNITRYKKFLKSNTEWQRPHDHNHLRITRVLKSLRLLIDDESALNFKYWIALQLGNHIDTINPKTKSYWRSM